MSDSGIPYLNDFGLSRILQVEMTITTGELAGSLRWMSPELLPAESSVTSSSDVWAYGMTILVSKGLSSIPKLTHNRRK